VTAPVPLGDGDAAIEPGEAARVAVPLTNPGTSALTGVRATLTSSTPGVVVGHATARYGTIAAGATVGSSAPFAITIPATVPCATVVALTITVTSDQGPALTAPISVPTGSGSSVVSSTQVPRAIPDYNANANPPTSVSSTLTITAPGRVGHLRFTFSAAHPYAGDLRMLLVSPSGTAVHLFDNVGQTGWTEADGFSSVVLDDDAPTSIQDVPTADGPAITGTYSAEEPLGRLENESRAGTWTLRVFDAGANDTGSLTAWSLSTDELTCAATGPALPSAATGAAAPSDTSAAVSGTVGAAGTPTAAAFEYGATDEYGAASAATGADGATSATLSGLAPSTTYHYRAVALRDGTVVAVGADQTFTTTAPRAAAPALAPPVVPRALLPAAVTPTVSKLATTLTADSKGRLSVSFTVPAAVAAAGTRSGTVTLKSAKKVRYGKSRKKRTLTAGTAKFTIPASGKVTVRLTLNATARAYVKAHGSLSVKAAFLIGKTTITKTVTVKKYKKPKKKSSKT
jgi:subtilisin-like proprotein convertase family protein